jgi:serine/threonine protein kinase/formylglycine-generating enzyme required for sulfatase activity
MSALETKCPPDALLSDFGLGKLDAASAETVSRHIETCADCRQRVASLSGDSFVGRLRKAGTAKAGERRDRSYSPGDSLANGARSTDGSSATENGLPRPSRSSDDRGEQDGLESPSSISAPELANHPDYELIKELGQGGMGTVYLARNRMMDRPEVLKVISKSLLAKPGALERFQQEIRSAARLQHPNIVAAYSVLRSGDLLVFAMEYVAGQDLSQVVKGRGYLPVANAAFYIHQVAVGLQHAFERGMVHRDIKPNNLMLAVQGKKHVVKILDFGLAKATSEKGAEAGLTKSGQMLGTPDYVAPEQTLDAHKADIRADIYSLGCTLYFLLSGGPPFQEASLYEILEAHHTREPKPLNLVRPDVPVELAAVVAKMMAKDPTKRYQTPSQVARALVPFFKTGQAAAPQPADNGQSPPSAETRHAVADATGVDSIAPAHRPPPLPLATAPVPVAMPAPVPAARPVDQFSGSIETRRAAARRRTWWSSLPPWQRMTALVAAGATAAILLGIVFLLQTKDGAIRVEIDDPQIEVAIEGTDVVLKQADNGHDVKLSPGEKTLVVERGDFKFETDKLVLKKAETVTVSVTLLDGEILVKQGNHVLGRGNLPPPVASDDAPTNGGLRDRLSSENERGALENKAKREVSPADGPAEQTNLVATLAVAPFDAKQARAYQEAWAKQLGVPIEQTNSIGMKLTLIPPGEFMMGSPDPELKALIEAVKDEGWHNQFRSESPQHRVRLTKAHYIGTYEVTQDEYKAVVGRNPSWFAVGGWGPQELVNGQDTSRHPAETISWFEAIDFCNKLSEKEKLPPYYSRQGDKVILLGGEGYRLPTEAEWENACRAGTTVRWPFGDIEAQYTEHAWLWPRTSPHPQRVGQKSANPFGLYDMLGNVWEWTWDGHAVYDPAVVADPVGPGDATERVMRGGSYNNTAQCSRSGMRWNVSPGSHWGNGGFRVARTLGPQAGSGPQGDVADGFSAGSIWKGKRTYRHGGYSPNSVTYELHVRERDGGRFKGHVFDNGPGRNRAEVEGEIDGKTLSWRERALHMDNLMTMQGTLEGDTIKLTFNGRYPNGATNDGDGELTRVVE